jgi:menaquinone-dependent protoporphyrinogen oxidase
MRVLVTWSSKRGGTAGIGAIIADTLASAGFEVVAVAAERASGIDTFDAVIVGGALYANRWPRPVRRFVTRHLRQLRRVPVWFFSSGPLDDSADTKGIPPSSHVAVLAERVGAQGHLTFGGRLEATATGFPARAMARTSSGDWRNPDRIRAWAAQVATALPQATAGQPVAHAARSVTRLLCHAAAGWTLCAAVMAVLPAIVGLTAAMILHAIAAPLFFTLIAWHYFRARGARDPMPVAITWTSAVALLDLVIVAGAVQRDWGMFRSVTGTWLPFALIFVATWATGTIMSMMPERTAGAYGAPQEKRHDRQDLVGIR